jgi:subtilase family serine protease
MSFLRLSIHRPFRQASPPGPARGSGLGKVARRALPLVSAAALVTGLLAAAPAEAISTAPSAVKYTRSCGTATAGHAACFALRRTDVVQSAGVRALAKNEVSPLVTPSGLSPASLISAYALPSATAGSGQTVGIVDAYNDPNAEADLAVYRAQYGLSACTTANGCFKKVSQTGSTTSLPANNSGWAGEIALDIEMVSAICPNCKIVLVEATSASYANLEAAEDRAVTLGAKFVSNSWGGSEFSGETTADTHFNHPGVAITASSGDSGYGASYPATSKYITAVGGTHLVTSSTTRGWTETAWSGAGSGCSSYETKPTWQTVTTGCSKRAEADVSAVADPATGVAVYQTYGASGWVVYGGTSVASPIIASVYALAGTPATGSYPVSLAYSNTASLNDVTSGSNGSCGAPLCTAGTGWDGPTGLGTPKGIGAF